MIALTMINMLTMTMMKMLMDVYMGLAITTAPHMTCTTFCTTITIYMTMTTITSNMNMMPTMAMDGRAAQESGTCEKGRQWQLAKSMLSTMTKAKVEPPTISVLHAMLSPPMFRNPFCPPNTFTDENPPTPHITSALGQQ